MNGQTHTGTLPLAVKIARLIEERGWSQEEFARIAGVNRHTIRQILHSGSQEARKLRNTTVAGCARALSLSVMDLRTAPLAELLERSRETAGPMAAAVRRRPYEVATQPALRDWVECNPDRAGELTPDEMDDLLSLQGTGGPMTELGVDHFVETIERKRRLVHQVEAIAGTEYIEELEKIVAILYDKVQPYRDRR